MRILNDFKKIPGLNSNSSKIFFLAISVLSLSACASLEAVSKTSTNLTTASKNWENVGNEVLATCERSKQIEPVTRCERSKTASEAVQAVNTVLKRYFEVMGEATNEKSFTIEAGVGSAASSIGEIPGIDEAKVKAASGLFSTLSKWATASLREKTLQSLIEEGGENAKTLINGLDQAVSAPLLDNLNEEEKNLASRFGSWFINMNVQTPIPLSNMCLPDKAIQFDRNNGGQAYLLVQEYCRSQKIIEDRKKAVNEYQKSLQSAQKALSELQNSSSSLSSDSLAETLEPINKDIGDSIKSLEEIF